MNNIENYNEKIFEDIKHIDEEGNEYWYARELQKTLDYTEWRKFEGVIKKAKMACLTSNINVNEHFVGVDKLSKRANNAEVIVNDYKLSRYACYLIAQNGDSRKESIAFAQTYFAVQTRRMELTEAKFNLLSEDGKSESKAIKTLYDVGKAIRETIAKLGGTMPEDLLIPKKFIKELKKERKYSKSN